MATWRCKLVRDAAVVILGVALLLLGGWWQRPHRIMAGLVILLLGLRGVPGGRPFLEVKTEASFADFFSRKGLKIKTGR